MRLGNWVAYWVHFFIFRIDSLAAEWFTMESKGGNHENRKGDVGDDRREYPNAAIL